MGVRQGNDKERDEAAVIAERVRVVRARIANAAAGANRQADAVRLVAVTKTVSAARVAAVVAAGVTDVGENYVQEARAKIPEVNALTNTESVWHLIGHLQRNKAKYCVGLFSLIHSVDNYQLAQEMGRQATKQGKTQAVLVEVNLAEQPERSGVRPDDALALCERIMGVPGLELRGLMGMAPYFQENAPQRARPFFARLRDLFEQLGSANRQTLSMGMSGDFEAAIAEGATLVRIGTALFGQRDNGSNKGG
jgi:pyridoxal phosphate enzyme (YggS family)